MGAPSFLKSLVLGMTEMKPVAFSDVNGACLCIEEFPHIGKDSIHKKV